MTLRRCRRPERPRLGGPRHKLDGRFVVPPDGHTSHGSGHSGTGFADPGSTGRAHPPSSDRISQGRWEIRLGTRTDMRKSLQRACTSESSPRWRATLRPYRICRSMSGLGCRCWWIGNGFMDTSRSEPAVSGVVVATRPVLRLAVAAYLTRFKASRGSTESDLRGFLVWCEDRGLDAFTATRPHLELYLRWLQEVRRYRPSTVPRQMSVVAGFYRTCVIDGVLEH